MNKVKTEFERENPLECIICNQILKQPVLLPCGHTVCKAHETERQEMNAEIFCVGCNKTHEIPANGYPTNLIVENLLRRNFQNIDFGEEHLKATNAFKELNEFMKKMRQMKKDPESEIHEIVWELKNKIDLRREELKKRIDEEAQKLISELDEFEKTSLMNNEKIDEIKQSFKLTKMLDNFQKECSTWQKQLRSFERDVEKWKSIQSECLSKLKCLNREYESFKHKIFDDRLFDIEMKQTKFCLDQNEPLL